MNLVFSAAAAFYLGCLAATQTAYGWPFMLTRWVALGLLFLIGLAYWASRQNRIVGGRSDTARSILVIYLSCTFLSVLGAENPTFSGLKWGVHVIMIVSFMFFLREAVEYKNARHMVILLKILTGGLLVLSIVHPATRTVFDTQELYRGAMGNANTLGHSSALCALLFLHSAIRSSNMTHRGINAFVGGGAVVMLWMSGARSSMVAFALGLTLIVWFYGVLRPPTIVAVLLTLVIAMIVTPQFESKAFKFVLKLKSREDVESVTDLLDTRKNIWAKSWEAFLERPMLGWGFGAASDIKKDWVVRPWAMGAHSRDDVNDFCFVLEGSGLVGLAGYVLLIGLIISQYPARSQIAVLRARYEAQTGVHEDREKFCSLHAIAYIISVSLLMLFMWDCSAFSAGSFPSAIMWACAGIAGGMQARALGASAGRRRGPALRRNGIRATVGADT